MDDFLTPEETARRLKVQVSTVRRWLRDGTLHGHKLGRLWRISSGELLHMAGAHGPVTPQTNGIDRTEAN
jgi:excisionase family DNA binding protein